jgi:tRNA (adenine57-N1/adenine58-N1)-methyltransferase
MDFGRDMSKTPGIVAKSNIRLVDETALGDDPLDRQVCLKANEAARELFFGKDCTSSSSSSSSSLKQDNGNEVDNNTLNLIDCSLYDEQHLPPARHLIAPGDLVVVFESFNDLNFVYATPNAIFSNRNGHFHHNDFIGKPYGCKIRSKDNEGLGFLYLLRPTPELWARSLPHRTQIVHELDASMITHYLEISPNMTVCESGTGSGAMSHVILRSIAPRGKLHTYEFNKMRVTKARKEFEGHGLGHLVECHHRDVCGKKNLLAVKNGDRRNENDQFAEEGNLTDSTTTDLDNNNNDMEEEEEDDGKGGFQLGQAAAHAIFLDLPEPWLAVPHAAYTIKPNGRICSYSPCMEQTQRTVQAMKKHGFHSIRTVEARLKEYYVDEYEMETPPTTLLEIPTEEAVSLEKERQVGGNQKPKEKEDKALNDEKGNNKKRSNDSSNVGPTKKILCARPFAHMRGHTAFLTFATASNTLRPDPNSQT